MVIDCENCGHCVDLHAPRSDDPQILKETRERITQRIKEWLKKE